MTNHTNAQFEGGHAYDIHFHKAGAGARGPFRLEQVMANLLNNAMRHTPAGGFIRVGVSRAGENEGEPIDERELPLIWEKFYRVDKSRDRESGGTELGLNILKNILLLHGARFGAGNTEHGLKFIFELPMDEA
jgi:signal transduction histidine kinase